MSEEVSFEPKNDLETELLKAQQGEIAGEAFLQTLLQSQVFMPVRDKHQIATDRQDSRSGRPEGAPEGGAPGTARIHFQSSDQAVPLTLESEDGHSVLVLFSSPERGQGFLQDYPEYAGGLLVEFTWVLERLGSGVGIALNPELPVGVELDPEMVGQILGALKG